MKGRENLQAPILIIGAGISGLALARVLKHHGLRVRVFERNSRTRHQGYGITLRGWATSPLCNEIGVTHDELVSGVATDTLIRGRGKIDPTISDLFTGQPLIRVERAPTGRPQAQFFRANRNRIRDFLLEGANVKFESQLRAVEDDSKGGVIAVLANGEKVRGALLIGADGVNSTVRSLLLPGLKPKVNPASIATGIRQVSRSEFDRTLADYLHGSNVLAAAGDNLLVSWTVVDITEVSVELFWTYIRPAEDERDPMFLVNRDPGGAPKLKSIVIEESAKLGKVAQPFAQIFDQNRIQSDEMFNWLMKSIIIPNSDLSNLLTRKVVLIGDAAHAMPIFAGEGGNHGLLDAVELGARLGKKEISAAEGTAEFYRNAEARWKNAVEGSIKGLSRLAQPLEVWRKLAAQA